MKPYQSPNRRSLWPRAREPTTTPSPPRDSTRVLPRVPAVWPTPAFVIPTLNALLPFFTHPGGAVRPLNVIVAHRGEYGFCPRITFSIAPMNPEQSKPIGPTPPQMYGLPACAFAQLRARAIFGPPTPPAPRLSASLL